MKKDKADPPGLNLLSNYEHGVYHTRLVLQYLAHRDIYPYASVDDYTILLQTGASKVFGRRRYLIFEVADAAAGMSVKIVNGMLLAKSIPLLGFITAETIGYRLYCVIADVPMDKALFIGGEYLTLKQYEYSE